MCAVCNLQYTIRRWKLTHNSLVCCFLTHLKFTFKHVLEVILFLFCLWIPMLCSVCMFILFSNLFIFDFDRQILPAISTSELMPFLEEALQFEVIGIDEGQFVSYHLAQFFWFCFLIMSRWYSFMPLSRCKHVCVCVRACVHMRETEVEREMVSSFAVQPFLPCIWQNSCFSCGKLSTVEAWYNKVGHYEVPTMVKQSSGPGQNFSLLHKKKLSDTAKSDIM